MNIYTYIYIYIHTYMYIYVYIAVPFLRHFQKLQLLMIKHFVVAINFLFGKILNENSIIGR